MSHSLTAKQRLWLACLGLEASESATDEACHALLEEAGSSGRQAEPPNVGQQRLAQVIGVTFNPTDTGRDAAGKLFAVLMLRGWVYSVWRTISGETSGRYDRLSLPPDRAISMARQMEAAGLFESIQQFPTMDEPGADIFYDVSKATLETKAFQFVAGRLPTLPPSTRHPG